MPGISHLRVWNCLGLSVLGWPSKAHGQRGPNWIWIVCDGAVDVQVKSLSTMCKATILSGKKQTFCGYVNVTGSILDYEWSLYRLQVRSQAGLRCISCLHRELCIYMYLFLEKISCYYLFQINQNGLFFQRSSKSMNYILVSKRWKGVHLQWKNTPILLLSEELPTQIQSRQVWKLVFKAILVFLQSMCIESYLSRSLPLKMEMHLC